MLKRFLSLTLAIVMVLGMLPWMEQPAEAKILSLSELQEKFPHGKYWNHAKPGRANNNPDGYTDTPCSCHGRDYCREDKKGDCRCNYFNGGVQCFGFAYKLAYDAYGSYASGWANGSLSTLKAGDVIRYKNDGHSIWVTAVNGETIIYADCNSDKEGNTCVIQWNQTTTKSKVRNSLTWIKSAPYELSGGGSSPQETDTRYPTPFKAFTLERKNIDCYNWVNGSRVGSIWPDDECTIQEIYTNGWCRLSCPWPSDANGYKIVYAPISAFIDTSYLVSEHNILTIAAGYTRKDMANWYANISEGTHFWRIGKTGPGGYTQIIYHDGSSYRAMWITHPGDKVEGLNIGSDFYAYIINSEQWRHVTNDQNNVSLRTSTSNESQIWRFVYQGNGYYKIYSCLDGKLLEVYGAKADSGTNVQVYTSNNSSAQYWMICGRWNGEITLEPKCSTCVLDVTGGAQGTGLLEGANMEIWTRNGGDAQRFHLWQGIDLTVTYDANGGAGAPSSRTEQYMTTFALSTTKPVKTGYTFLGWSTSDSATSATYTAGQNFTIKGNTTLYAVWKKGCPDKHSYTYKVNKAPTVSTTGALTGTCSKCGGTTTITLPKLNKTDYSYTVKTAATCTAGGTDRYTWKNTTYGSFYFDVATSAKGHSYSKKVTDPTCTAQGYTTYTCSCGYSYRDNYTNATGHSYTSKVTKAATCTADGVKTFSCGTCGHQYTQAIAKLGHDYKATVTAPTCTAQGYTTHKCSRCSDSYKDTYKSALGHNFSNGSCTRCGTGCNHSYTSKVTKAATCTADGVKTYTCGTCGHKYTESVAKLGHDYKATITAPTCTAQGYTTHKCSHCSDSYKDTYKSALGHNFSNGSCTRCGTGCNHSYTSKVTKAATCTADGVKTYTCGTCGHKYTESVAKLGHDYKATVTAPTCTAQGYTTHKCSRCSDSYKDTYKAALGHSFSYEMTTEPTDWREGELSGSCARCAVATTVTMPKLNTTDYEYEVVFEPSCGIEGECSYTWKVTTYGTYCIYGTIEGLGPYYSYAVIEKPTASSDGILERLCNICWETEWLALPKLNTTDYSYGVTKAATCTASGTGRYTWKNTNYGKFYFDVTIPATGHSFGQVTVHTPAPGVQGYSEHTCTSCGFHEKFDYVDFRGVSVSGTVTSYLTDGAVTVRLMQSGKAVYSTTLTGKNAAYTFDAVEPGTYTLEIRKANHITRSFRIEVTDTNVVQDAKICPEGDVTGDGVVNIKDFQRLLRHVNKTNSLSGYTLSCGDVTGDGTCNIKDFQRLLRHVNKTNPLF